MCDDHLGKLCRLLRLIGSDALWCREGRDAAIVAASAAGRLFVTRDTSWADKTLPGPRLILAASDPWAQLREVVTACGLTVAEESLWRRCLVCNAPTEDAAKEDVASRLPPYVRKTRDAFRLCPGCGRIYWEGTHVAALRRRLRLEGIL